MQGLKKFLHEKFKDTLMEQSILKIFQHEFFKAPSLL